MSFRACGSTPTGSRARSRPAEKSTPPSDGFKSGFGTLDSRSSLYATRTFFPTRSAFFRELLVQLGHEVTDEEIHEALTGDIRVKRVHGDDLSEFFTNADELEARFGDAFEAWQ